ncbi:MAG: dienelactone hydrolase family protein [Deltaproteobacteria bacterium]|nr:dienelactone hydrolase family protein [Deltaproteobacteria bacterium]
MNRARITALWLVLISALWCTLAQAQDAGVAQGGVTSDGSTGSDGSTADEVPWCPEGIETLAGSVCAVVPDSLPDNVPRTLVIFLHGVVQPGSGWQHNPIRGMGAAAKRLGFALIAPRGRRGVARAEMNDYWAWPTSSAAQQQHEAAVIAEWMEARRILEDRAGRKFDKVFVFGFSSGAYYASSLALRGRLPVDGYAVFAGGAAPYTRPMMSHVRLRPPIFVGYGLKDKSAVKDCKKLAAALRALRWKHREMAVPKAGHTITDAQLREAIGFLRRS